MWTLKDLLGILNHENKVDSYLSKYGKVIKFSTLYRSIKKSKHLYLTKDIPEETCLCEKCENLELLCQGIRHAVSFLSTILSNELFEIMKLFSCDLTCWNELDEVTFYQWGKASNKYPEKLSQCLSGEECYNLLLNQIKNVKWHLYLRFNQHKKLKIEKENLADKSIDYPC